MDFVLRAVDQARARSVRELGRRLSAGDMIARDRAGLFSHDAWKELAAAGLTGLPVPRQYSGQGADAQTIVTILAALGETCTDNGLMFALGAHLWACTDPIARFGDDQQRQRWLPGLCDGSLIGAHAATEPEAGSAAATIRTTAMPATDGWLLNGEKTFVTNASVADVFLVTAVTDARRGWLGISAFLVPRTAPGLTIGPVIEKAGLRTATMASLTLRECRLQPAALLGPLGGGMAMFTATMTHERAFILAPIVGVLRRLATQCTAYARQRRQDGTPIAHFGGVARRLAELRLRAETAELLAHKVAWLADQQQLGPDHAAMVKLHLSEAFAASAADAVQIHGGYGYTTAAELERMTRDAMGALLYSGTSDIQRTVIARAHPMNQGS